MFAPTIPKIAKKTSGCWIAEIVVNVVSFLLAGFFVLFIGGYFVASVDHVATFVQNTRKESNEKLASLSTAATVNLSPGGRLTDIV